MWHNHIMDETQKKKKNSAKFNRNDILYLEEHLASQNQNEAQQQNPLNYDLFMING